MANTLEVQLSASIGEFQKQMSQAANTLRDTAKQMGASFGEQAQATRVAANEQDSLLAKLKEFKGEQVQQSRMARFYASELMTIVPAGDAVKGKLQEILNSGLELVGKSGPLFLMVAAFEAGKFALKAWTEQQAEAKARAEEHAKTIRGLAEAFDKFSVSVLGASETEKTFLESTKTQRSELASKTKELAEQEEKLAALNADNEEGMRGVQIERMEKQREEIEKRISVLRNEIDIAKALQGEADKNLQASKAPAAANKATVEDDKKAKDAADYELKEYARQLQLEEELDREASARADKNLEEDTKRRQKQLEDDLKFEVAETKRAEDDKAKAMDDAGKRAKAILDQQAAEVASATMVWERMASSISNSFAMGFTQAIFHASSFEEGMFAIFDGIEKAFERMIEQMIAKLVMSGILALFGEILGGPVGASLGKSAGGLLGSLFSFDVGSWNVPRDMVAQVHGGEIIVPPGPSAAIRSGKASIGAAGGDTYNVSISAIDAKSLRDYLSTGDGARGLLQAMGVLRRNGRA